MTSRKKKRRSGTGRSGPGVTAAIMDGAKRCSTSMIVIGIAFILVAAVTVLYYPNHAGDYDIWFHIKFGEHFVNETTWTIDQTAYSWTPVDGSWKYVTWIGSSMLYLIHSAGGVAALSVFQLLCLAVPVLLFLYLLRRRGRPLSMAYVLAILLFLVSINPTAIFIKPEQFTLVFFAVAVFLYFIGRETEKRAFFALPPLFLIWVNTHGAFIIGMFFLVFMLGLEIVNAFVFKKNPMNRDVLIAFSVSVGLAGLATFVNPFGPAYPLETVARMITGEKGQFEVLTAYFNRWEYLFPRVYVFRRTNTAWALVLLEISALWLFFRAYTKRRFVDIPLLAATVLFFFFAMSMARASLYFPAIWLFTVVRLVTVIDERDFEDRMAALSGAAVLLISFVCVHNTLTVNTYKYWFGSRLDEQAPVHETDYIREHDLPGPFFNDYLTGGYMIFSLYPDYKVFIDPRHRPYEATGVWNDYMTFRQRPGVEGLHDLNGCYPFRNALIHHSKYWQVAAAFLDSPEWRLVMFDRIGVVFSKVDVDREPPVSIPPVSHFADVKNPVLLFSIFRIYHALDMNEDAREAAALYDKNIPGYYKNRDLQTGVMRRMLAGR